MSPLALALATFVGAAAVVVVAGTWLARSGDVIAAHTKLGGLWVGSVLLAFATSLPEITTDVAAVRMGEVDLAAGDLFGSSMANMLILAVLNLLPTGAGLFRKAALEHALYASVAIILTATAAAVLLVGPTSTIVGVGPGSLLLLGIYLVGSRAIYRQSSIAREALATAETAGEGPDGSQAVAEDRPSLRRAIVTFVLASLVIFVAAPRFAHAAHALADASGLGTTVIGTWLVGFATSLPELVTCLAAVRIGAFDLAVGNLFGSNAFNMAIFPVLDLASTGGPVLGAVSSTHAISALTAIALMGVAIGALVSRAQGRLRVLEPGSAVMIVGYVLGLLAVLLSSGPR